VWLALVTAGCVEAPREPREPSQGAPHFTVMSYNIELGSVDSATLAAIGSANADVVALQEVTPEASRVIQEVYGEQYPYQLHRPTGGAGGLAVLSRDPLEDAGVHPGPGSWHPAWHVNVSLAAGVVQLLNVHLRSPLSASGGPVASWLASDADHREEISDFQSQCDGTRSNVVLGDFNEGPNGDAVQLLETEGFFNALPAFHPGQPTWRYRSVGSQLEATIDHVLADESLVPLDAWTLREGRSDHLPLIAHFEPVSF
jgi:vancomycin resistance protein VanJ